MRGRKGKQRSVVSTCASQMWRPTSDVMALSGEQSHRHHVREFDLNGCVFGGGRGTRSHPIL